MLLHRKKLNGKNNVRDAMLQLILEGIAKACKFVEAFSRFPTQRLNNSTNKELSMSDKLLELLFYAIPAVITGAVGFYFFKMHTDSDERRRRFALMRKNQKGALPLRLQAYERMVLFMERIDPSKMLLRITPISDDKNDYVNYVTAQVDQEFEHNLTQQIYMTDDCWGVITTAKNATVQILRKVAARTDVDDANQLREAVLREMFDNPAPSITALAYIKNEVKEFL
jgi:hypothetical protein